MTVIHLGDRLTVARTPEQREEHARQLLELRRATAARANASKQRAKRLLRTASWANYAKIAEVYRRAAYMTRRTGVQHDVDHIIPLQGRNVCGLHVETNLRVIPRTENRRKWNHFDAEVVGGAGIEPATSTV